MGRIDVSLAGTGALGGKSRLDVLGGCFVVASQRGDQGLGASVRRGPELLTQSIARRLVEESQRLIELPAQNVEECRLVDVVRRLGGVVAPGLQRQVWVDADLDARRQQCLDASRAVTLREGGQQFDSARIGEKAKLVRSRGELVRLIELARHQQVAQTSLDPDVVAQRTGVVFREGMREESGEIAGFLGAEGCGDACRQVDQRPGLALALRQPLRDQFALRLPEVGEVESGARFATRKGGARNIPRLLRTHRFRVGDGEHLEEELGCRRNGALFLRYIGK